MKKLTKELEKIQKEIKILLSTDLKNISEEDEKKWFSKIDRLLEKHYKIIKAGQSLGR